MFHRQEIAVNKATGVPVPGVIVRLYDSVGNPVSLYSDASGTPIVSVSGVADAAVSDDAGNYSYYVANGVYTERIYVGDSEAYSIPDLVCQGIVTTIQTPTFADASAISTSSDTQLVIVSGTNVVGDAGTGRTFAYDATVNAAYVTANPTTSFVDATGHGFKEITGSSAASLAGELASTAAGKGVALVYGSARPAATRSAMAAIAGANFPNVLLNESGRQGVFAWDSANHSTSVAADPLQGLYVAPASDPTGASGSWVRQWDGTTGYPEWFGAIVNSQASDALAANQAALPACHALCPKMQLANADYWHTDTLAFDTPYRTIRGHHGDYSGQGHGTRLILTGANAKTKTQAIFGAWPVPSTQADTPWGLNFEDFAVIRDDGAYPITPPASGDYQDAVMGVIFGGTTFSRFRHINVGGAQASWANGCVRTFIDDCYFQRGRSGDGTNTANDWMYGLIAGGPSPNYSFIGANASLYINRCEAAGSNDQVEPTGLYLVGYISDTFIDHFESASLKNGIIIDGQSLTGASAHQDVRLVHPVLDGCSGVGLAVKNVNDASLINVSDPYIEINANGQAFYASGAAGQITLNDGQIIGGGASPTNGIVLLNSNKVRVAGTLIRECSQPVYTSGIAQCDIAPTIFNGSISTAPVYLDGVCSRSRIAPVLSGASGIFTAGIVCNGTGTVDSEFNLTLVDPGAISGGAANKLTYNGSAWGGGSTFGTGNVITGVLG